MSITRSSCLMRPNPPSRPAQAGLGLPTALFIIVVMGFLATSMTALQTSTTQTFLTELLAQHARNAAFSAMELSTASVIPAGAPAAASCFAHVTTSLDALQSGMTGCTVTRSCTLFDLAGERYFELAATGTCETGEDQASVALSRTVRAVSP